MPHYNRRRGGPIQLYRDHIPCGNKSCRTSCDHNSLRCIGCLQYFHYKCKKLSQEAYRNIVDNDLDYICDDGVKGSCYGAFFPFFEIENRYFLDTIIDHDGLYPCKKCKAECLNDCIQCDVCDVWLHAECANLQYDLDCYVDDNDSTNDSLDFICCMWSLF